MIRIISIDDHRLFGDGLRAIIKQAPHMIMVNVYDNGMDITSIVEKDRPDIVLLDISLPGVSGISIAETIKKRYRGIRVIMLSMLYDDSIAKKLHAIGVEAYISKEIESDKLIEVIEGVYNGEQYYLANTELNPATVQILTENFQLTAREIEIVELIKQGKSNQEIADMLHRSVFTITTHRKNINQKLKSKLGQNHIQNLLDTHIVSGLSDNNE